MYALQQIERGDADEMEAEQGDRIADPALLAFWVDAGQSVEAALKRGERAGQFERPVDNPGNIGS